MRYLVLLLTFFLFGCQTTSGLNIPDKDKSNPKWTSSKLINAIEYSPNFEERKALMLVIHHTTNNEDAPTIRLFKSEVSKVSSHYLISRTGEITQLVDEEKRSYHAGLSSWGNIHDVNSVSIGIELSNDSVIPYTDEQINSLIMLSKDIMFRHRIQPNMVVGHLEVSPGRKIDPYINFPWDKLAKEGIVLQCKKDLKEIHLPENFSWEKTLSDIGYNSNQPEKSLISFRIRYFRLDSKIEIPNEEEKKYMHCLTQKNIN